MPNKIVRGKTIQCRVSDEEYNKIDSEADKIGLSVSSYSRMVCLISKIDASIDPTQFINMLKMSEGYKDKTIQRDKIIQCRVSDEEYQEIETKANNIGLSIISYLRMVCLFSKLDIVTSPQNI
jgi:predicted DNA binding CopG/RHH family protein